MAEVFAEHCVETLGLRVIGSHEGLHFQEALWELHIGREIDAQKSCEVVRGLLREVHCADTVISRPFITRGGGGEVHRAERQLIQASRDVAVAVKVTTSFAGTHRHAQNSLDAIRHQCRKGGDVSVVFNLQGNVPLFLDGVEHVLRFLVFLRLDGTEQGGDADAVVNHYARRASADCVDARKVPCSNGEAFIELFKMVRRVSCIARIPGEFIAETDFAIFDC